MKIDLPLAHLGAVTAFVFGCAAVGPNTAYAQQDGQIYAQSDLERAARDLLRGDKESRAAKERQRQEQEDADRADAPLTARERRALRERREQHDAELADPSLTARERRAIRERQEREDAELGYPRQDARERYIERQRETQLEQAERDRARQRNRVNPAAPAGRDAEDPRFAPGGKP